MTDLTNSGANDSAVAVFGAGTFFISLHSGDPGFDGLDNELSTANGYARQPTTFTVTGPTAASDDALTFSGTGDNGTVTHFAIFDAVTGGDCKARNPLGSPVAWPGGDLNAAAGIFTVTYQTGP